MKALQLGKYKHYKGMICKVIAIARHSETLEKYVVYKEFGDNPKYGKDSMWVRPLSMFMEKVEVDRKLVPRFEYLGK